MDQRQGTRAQGHKGTRAHGQRLAGGFLLGFPQSQSFYTKDRRPDGPKSNRFQHAFQPIVRPPIGQRRLLISDVSEPESLHILRGFC